MLRDKAGRAYLRFWGGTLVADGDAKTSRVLLLLALNQVSSELRLQSGRKNHRGRCRYHCNFAYSALASLRMGMSGSASFQRVRKSL